MKDHRWMDTADLTEVPRICGILQFLKMSQSFPGPGEPHFYGKQINQTANCEICRDVTSLFKPCVS